MILGIHCKKRMRLKRIKTDMSMNAYKTPNDNTIYMTRCPKPSALEEYKKAKEG